MLLFAVLLVGVAVVLGFFAQANQDSHDFTLFGATWHTYDWVPAAIAAGALAVICLAAMGYAMMRIASLQRAAARLREEVALFKLDRATSERAAAETEKMREREVVGRTDTSGIQRREVVAERDHNPVVAEPYRTGEPAVRAPMATPSERTPI